LKLISFKISGAFAAFRDPSVTSNQTAYYIPSKSAVIGILGAIIGISRPNNLGELYSKEYQKFLKATKIGLQFESKPRKITFFTNHRSLKEAKTKPFKSELVESPSYTVYVKSDEKNYDKIWNALRDNKFTYTPYLGHVYCPAVIKSSKQIDAEIIAKSKDETTKCVILDESETYNQNFELKYQMITENGTVIIERHIHHFFDENDKLDGRVLKHWIPTENSEIEIRNNITGSLMSFYKTGKHVICMY